MPAGTGRMVHIISQDKTGITMIDTERVRAFRTSWHRRLKPQANAGFWRQLLAWLLLVMMLIVGFALMLLTLLLSLLLLPLFIYRGRRAWRQAARGVRHPPPGGDGSGRVIEGEVIERDER